VKTLQCRKIKKGEGRKYLELLKKLDQETSFMLYEVGERKTTVKKMKQKISQINNRGGTIIGAELNEELVGFISASRLPLQRVKHSVYIVIGVLKKASGKGVGTKLFKQLISWAKDNDITRLELTVMVHNKRAINLYKKIGFVIEGIKKKSLLIDGNYVDEYFMGMIL